MSERRRYAYPLTIMAEKDGGFSAWFKQLPGGTCGETRGEVEERARDLLKTSLSLLVEEGEKLPEPGRPGPDDVLIEVSPLDVVKLELHQAMLMSGVSNVELARKLGIDEKSVRRLRDPAHRSRIENLERALSVLNRRLEVTVSSF